MACSFPCLPSQHNELHYSAPLSATIAGLFWRDTPLVVRLKLGKDTPKDKQEERKLLKMWPCVVQGIQHDVNTAMGMSLIPIVGTHD